ncbi:MAG: short-chain fatty acyl-CoA regulator family protein [Pseudomonadota bacterium]
MGKDRSIYIGPRLRQLRRRLGLTQATMAAELEISASYVALIERNQRPLTADLLLRLAQTYQVDIADFAGDGGAKVAGRLSGILRDPLFSDLDLGPTDQEELASGHPGMAEVIVRLYNAYREAQLSPAYEAEGGHTLNPLEETRTFLSARQNYFPVLDEQAERLAQRVKEARGMATYLEEAHNYRVRRLPPDIMHGAIRRLDLHRRQLSLDDTLDAAGEAFQIALQLAYAELSDAISAALKEGQFTQETSERLAQRALANYAAGAILMPYTAFFREAEARAYDVEALCRHFGTSFEQTAHRLTTLQKPGQAGVPFFFIRVDAAGNVLKRIDGGAFPFAHHKGSCPVWSLHHCFRKPRQIQTETLELPDGERFFSIARTVTAGGGSYKAPTATLAAAIGCSIEHAKRLIYVADQEDSENATATPIGVACPLCQKATAPPPPDPPSGRSLLPDEYRRLRTPIGTSDMQ